MSQRFNPAGCMTELSPRQMKLAFLVAAHAHPRLLARLVRRLESPLSSIFIHIDRRVDIRPFEDVFREQKIEGIHWVPRVLSGWGSYGQVKASLSLLREGLKYDPKAERFILLSGQDYPLMPAGKIASFFQEKAGVDCFTFSRIPWEKWPDAGGLDRLQRFHFPLGKYSFTYPNEIVPGSRLVRAAYKACEILLPKKRTLPENITFYGGSNWWNLTRSSVESIFDFLRSRPDFLRLFRLTKSADEILFQTVLLNLPAVPRIENDDLRCVFWDGRRNEFPAVMRLEDFSEIAASGKLFARKIHPQYSLPLLDRIDRELLQ